MKVIAKKNRELALINAQNTQNENRAETITLVVPEEYEDYNKKIVFVTDDGIVWDIIQDNTYKLTKAITKYKQVDFYIWLTKEVDGESIDFRTKTKTLSFYDNEDASDEITDEEIHGVNTVVNLLEEEIEKVENLNIEATKIGNTTTVTITKKDGTTESVEINDGADGQDGQDGYTPQKGIDYFTEQDIEEIEGDILNEVYTKSETDTLLDEKADIEDIPDVSSFITKDVNNLTNYTLKTNTGSLIDLEINDTTYVVTLKLKNQDGTIISTDTIDLPLESVVVSGRYDNTTKKVILTLENGSEVDFSVADLVAGLQTEITSSNKLASDLVDDTNSGNKFVTTSEKQTWNNKLDESDLTDYVKNTDYATSSKGGVVKAGHNIGINATTGVLSASNTSFQSYENLDNYALIGKGQLENVISGKQLINQTQLEESQETQDEDIEKLQTENARFKATLPTTTGEGKEVTLNKTAEMEFKKPPLPMGNSEQESTNGTNLIGLDTEQYRVDLSEGDKLTITNNTSEQIVMDLYSNYGDTQRNDWFSFVANDTRTITLLHDTKAIAWRNAINGIAWCNSGETALPYEKYTGGTASPNPDYPQEITNVTGDVEVKVQNKNLLDMIEKQSYTENGITVTNNKDGSFTLNGTNTNSSHIDLYITPNTSSQTIIKDLENGTYLLKIYELNGNINFNSKTCYVIATGKGENNQYLNSMMEFALHNNKQYQVKSLEGCKLIAVKFYIGPGITFNNYRFKIMMTKSNDTSLPYVEHKHQTFTFPLGNEKLMLGDYLADDGIHHVRGQVRLDSLTWDYESYANRYKCNNVSDLNIKGAVSDGEPSTQILSNIFTIYSNNMIGSPNFYNPGIGITTTGLIRAKYTNTTDVNVFEEMLTTKNAILEYELNEETITPYTSAQQEVYNQIKQAISYAEQTNISSNTIALFNVEAYQSTKLVLEENNAKYESLEARVALLE